MRKTLKAILEIIEELHVLRGELEPEMQGCLKTFYDLGRAKTLTARGRKRPDGKIRGIYLASRTRRAFLKIGGRNVRLSHYLSGPINDGLIHEIARDQAHAEDWRAADSDRRALNARSALLAYLHRDLRLALANKFGRTVTDADRAATQRILAKAHYLQQEDHPAVLGAVVYDRLLSEIELKILDVVDRWKTSMRGLPFEPLVRWRESGPLRLTWAYVDRFHDALGVFQVRSHDIAGGVTDRWLRKNYPQGGAPRRKAVLAYAIELRSLKAEYSQLLVYVGRLKAKVHQVLRMDASDGRAAV